VRRHEQTMTLRKMEPICIATPEGLVRILPGKGRKILIELPEAMKAHVGVERAIEEHRFLKRLPNGAVAPAFEILLPETDEDGALMGVKTPPLRRLAEGGAA